ncbi:G2/mitotic-specific cyclin 2 [Nematocida homosporus]|uniref:G2/mitotic-specific cyclin 2 n=1 Tax=Nematocida homosporus TaxID=1912981 RepID=UPI002220CEAF|nr:G2/mitotic-specific cyclin 2 [Nematocida homosporus]KAI5185128.1 G2/mitotic-specific cyclin 2 [Nematocida homosporus]
MKVTNENVILIGNRDKRGVRRPFAEVRNRRRSSPISKVEGKYLLNEQIPSEYVVSILARYQLEERMFMAVPEYMSFQDELRWAMRTVLVDWIIDVHSKLNLLPETLYLAVNLIDRFLSVRVVSIGKLQLVGVSGLLVASKFQEVASPSVQTFVGLTDRSFTEEEILRAEKYLLHCLEYRMGYPSPLNWLRRAAGAEEEVERLGVVVLDLVILDEHFLRYPPSLLGSCAAYVARALLEVGEWEVFHHFCVYTIEEMAECLRALKSALGRPIVHESVFKKHGTGFTKHLEKVSLIGPEVGRQ